MNDENLLAQLAQARPSAAPQNLLLLFRCLDQLERRISQLEARVRELTTRSSDQDQAIRMMCSVLKDIDDPYGFGQSLDERIFGDATQEPAEERDE